ncbi:2-phosphosulfolactate phosphatase [Erwinia sp.]|uniref:2-phosphosulfolactate phosphatase n=1 Tax=Erwinia citreus TaxID=558 RepID=UPI003C760281
MTWYKQNAYAIRLEWGMTGVEQLADLTDCIIVVDVMSFSSCVSLAVSRGAAIYPWPWKDDPALEYGQKQQALVASADRRFVADGFSLSPHSLLSINAGTKLVLPSPNGSTISFRARESRAAVFSGCLRNLSATVDACKQFEKILVIACGERWPDGTLRPAIEDLTAAGGLIALLQAEGRSVSPEAAAAVAVWQQGIAELHHCASARELIARGFEEDVALCLDINADSYASQLKGDFYAC